mgnify:CR=1 FL=1
MEIIIRDIGTIATAAREFIAHMGDHKIFAFYGSMGAGKTLQGVQLYVTDAKAARLTEIQFHILEVIAELNPERAAFNLAPENRHRMFDIVTGNDYFRKTFALRHRFEDIQGRWRADEEAFKTRSQAYYLYK